MVLIIYGGTIYEALELENGYLLLDSGVIVPVTKVIYLKEAA